MTKHSLYWLNIILLSTLKKSHLDFRKIAFMKGLYKLWDYCFLMNYSFQCLLFVWYFINNFVIFLFDLDKVLLFWFISMAFWQVSYAYTYRSWLFRTINLKYMKLLNALQKSKMDAYTLGRYNIILGLYIIGLFLFYKFLAAYQHKIVGHHQW